MSVIDSVATVANKVGITVQDDLGEGIPVVAARGQRDQIRLAVLRVPGQDLLVADLGCVQTRAGAELEIPVLTDAVFELDRPGSVTSVAVFS